MGILQDQDTLRGIGLPDQRVTFENLNPVDASATGSDYDEAGPRPGTAIAADPKARLIVEVQNAQGEDLEVYVAKPGDPGPDAPAEILFRESDEAADPLEGWRAWNRPSFFHHLFTVDYEPTIGLGADTFDTAVHPDTQIVILVYVKGGQIRSRTFDGSGWSVERAVSLFSAIGDCCVEFLPSGRAIAATTSGSRNVFFSDDFGVTWALYAEAAFPFTVASPRRSRMVLSGDVLVVIREAVAAPNIWIQFVSRDLGATFTQVDVLAVGQFPELMAFPDGSIGVFYKNNPTGEATFRRVGSPFTPLNDTTGIIVAAGVVDMTVATVEPDGVIWGITKDPGSMDHTVHTSTDSGATWTALDSDVISFVNDDGPRAPQGTLASIDGSIAWFHQWRDDLGAADQESIHVAWLGGWQNVGVDPDAGWGAGGGLFVEGDRAAYWPVNRPALGGSPWAVSGGGTDTIISPNVLEVVTVGQTRGFTDSFTSLTNIGRFKGICYFQHVSGGSLTSQQAGFDVELGDGVSGYHFSVRVSEETGTSAQETRFRVVDEVSGGTLFETTPVPNNLLVFLEFLVDVDGATGNLELEWRESNPAKPGAQWQTAFSGALTIDVGAPLAIGRFRWAHTPLVSTAVTRWILVAYKAVDTGGASSFDDFFAYDVDKKRGRSIGGIGYPFGFIEGEIPDARTLSTGVVLGALRGGPARLAETFSIPAAYDFGVENLFAELSPSPRSTWRNTDRVPVHFSWTFPLESRIGDSWILGVLVERPNFTRVLIDVDTSATGTGTWVQIGEMNLAEGLEGLGYVREGDIVRPDKSLPTINADRYIHRAALAGGLFVPIGGTATRIVGNNSGRWGPGSDRVDPYLRVAENVTGLTTSTCSIVPPRAMFFLQLDGVVADFVTGIRLRIPNDIAVVDEAFVECGLLRTLALVPFGQQPSRGWTQEMSPNTSETDSRSGTIRKRQEGPPLRTWSWSWADSIKMQSIRQDLAPDYLGAPGKPPAMTDQDVWTLLWGMIEETKGGELPIVACNFIPKITGVGLTVNDRTLFMYGTLDGSGRFDHVVGDEGIDEFGRVSPIAVREIG